MKKISYVYIFYFCLLQNISLKAQEFPDFSFETSRTCVTYPPTSDDQRRYRDFFRDCQPQGKWRPISGSADLLLTRISNTTTGGFFIGAGVEYSIPIPSNPQPPCDYNGINHGEGLMYIGKQFLNLMGLDVKSFAVAGSIVIFIIALEMVLGLDFFKSENNDKTGSMVPIAFPLIAGSGTLTTIMSLKANYNDVNILLGILINCIIIFLVLGSLKWIERALGPNGLLVVRKFFGVILLAIAVKIFGTNIVNFGK